MKTDIVRIFLPDQEKSIFQLKAGAEVDVEVKPTAIEAEIAGRAKLFAPLSVICYIISILYKLIDQVRLIKKEQ
jgi:hypothetical protein